MRHTVQRFINEQQTDEEDEAALLASFRKVAAFVRFVFCSVQYNYTVLF